MVASKRSRNSLVLFTGIRWYSLRESLPWRNKFTFTSFVLLGMLSERNAPKNGVPTVGFSFKTMLQHSGHFLFKNFLAKNNVTTLEHPPYSHDHLHIIFTCSFHLNKLLMDETFVMLLTSLRMQRRSWKGFYKMSSRDVFNNFTLAFRSVSLHKGAILKEL